jgi:hypothetical protein
VSIAPIYTGDREKEDGDFRPAQVKSSLGELILLDKNWAWLHVSVIPAKVGSIK